MIRPRSPPLPPLSIPPHKEAILRCLQLRQDNLGLCLILDHRTALWMSRKRDQSRSLLHLLAYWTHFPSISDFCSQCASVFMSKAVMGQEMTSLSTHKVRAHQNSFMALIKHKAHRYCTNRLLSRHYLDLTLTTAVDLIDCQFAVKLPEQKQVSRPLFIFTPVVSVCIEKVCCLNFKISHQWTHHQWNGRCSHSCSHTVNCYAEV